MAQRRFPAPVAGPGDVERGQRRLHLAAEEIEHRPIAVCVVGTGAIGQTVIDALRDDVPRRVGGGDLPERRERQRGRGIPVVAHCRAGFGRTGTMLACYLVTQGFHAEQAVASVREKRPGSVETPEQERFVAEFEKYWRKGPLAQKSSV